MSLRNTNRQKRRAAECKVVAMPDAVEQFATSMPLPPSSIPEPHDPFRNSVNAEASFYGGGPSLLNNCAPILMTNDVPMRQEAVYGNFTTTDEIKWLLWGISSRLDTLEAAILRGHAKTEQLETYVALLTGNLARRV